MDCCTVCLRPLAATPNVRPWCSWCSDYADRYASRLPDGIHVVCVVEPVRRGLHGLHLSLNADVFGTWTWEALAIEVQNRSPVPVSVRYPGTPLTCLEMVVRGGENRLSPRPGQHSDLPAAAPGQLRTEIPPGGRLWLTVDPMAGIAPDAIRAGEYTALAVFRQAGWQVVSEPVPFRVESAEWVLRG